jgi:serine/threonine protein kinase
MKFCNACGRGNPPESSACERCQAPFGQGGDAEGGLGPGTTLKEGAYKIVRHLGQGGMGTVYVAQDLRLEREVAVKLLNRDLMGHATARIRMEREAKALARLNHPNVVDIYDVFEHEGTLALVIEYVKGGALTDRLSQGAMPWSEAVRFIDGILSGLEGLHEAGLVHRDLKPDNVLIDPRGDTPKITDLGVAHDAIGRGMTKQGTRLGTPEYMSPEQVRGQEIDKRSDIYGAGIVLYEMLTGEVPFSGDSDFDIWEAHIRQAPDLGRLDPTIPMPLREAIGRALAKDPSARFSSAETMRKALTFSEPSADDHAQAVEQAVQAALQHQAEVFRKKVRTTQTALKEELKERDGDHSQAVEQAVQVALQHQATVFEKKVRGTKAALREQLTAQAKRQDEEREQLNQLHLRATDEIKNLRLKIDELKATIDTNQSHLKVEHGSGSTQPHRRTPDLVEAKQGHQKERPERKKEPAPEASAPKCESCDGRGRVPLIVDLPFFHKTCPACGGLGATGPSIWGDDESELREFLEEVQPSLARAGRTLANWADNHFSMAVFVIVTVTITVWGLAALAC